MRKPVVNLRQFRFSKLRAPEYAHLLWLSAWIPYCAFFCLTEALIPAENCHVMHCVLDDLIPFCEWFSIFYVAWYAFVAGALLYFALYSPESFVNLMKYIIVTQVVAIAVYILYPSRQDLRPEAFPRDNLFTRLMGCLYSIDTSTNVCPSLHVAWSLAVASAVTKEKGLSLPIKVATVVLAVLISLSTAFVKQHSVVDIFWALWLGVLAELLVYGLPIPIRKESHHGKTDSSHG